MTNMNHFNLNINANINELTSVYVITCLCYICDHNGKSESCQTVFPVLVI